MTEEKEQDGYACQTCGLIGEAPHTCPFKEDMNNDKTLCNCCTECQYQCCTDI